MQLKMRSIMIIITISTLILGEEAGMKRSRDWLLTGNRILSLSTPDGGRKENQTAPPSSSSFPSSSSSSSSYKD